jgi:hypothetical protein
MPTISETAGLVMVGFLVSRYQLHTVPVDVITSFQEMESQYKVRVTCLSTLPSCACLDGRPLFFAPQ